MDEELNGEVLVISNDVKRVLDDASLVSLNTEVSRQAAIAFGDNLHPAPIRPTNHIWDLMKVEDHRQLEAPGREIRNSTGL